MHVDLTFGFLFFEFFTLASMVKRVCDKFGGSHFFL